MLLRVRAALIAMLVVLAVCAAAFAQSAVKLATVVPEASIWDKNLMLDIGLAPVVGGTVITTKAWNKIPQKDRATLVESAAAVEKRLQAEVPKQDQAAIAEMTRRGLTVTKASGAEWRAEADALARTMRGEMVPADIFDLATRARDEFRKQQPPGPRTP